LTALAGALNYLSALEPVQQVPKKQRVANDENRYIDYCTGLAAELAELPRHKAMEIRMKMEQLIYAAWTEVAASEARKRNEKMKQSPEASTTMKTLRGRSRRERLMTESDSTR
jgi:hypothetical protein